MSDLDDLITTITSIEGRLDAVERVILEVSSIVKILKPILIVIAAGFGLELQAILTS